MLKKRTLKSGKVKITFEVDYLPDADLVEITGDWNEWELEPMKKYKNGKHKYWATLDPKQEYQFRYRIDDEKWENEWEADKYAPNEHGTENSVVVC